jgi:hypothetical protein
MTHGIVVNVPAPLEMYRAVNAEVSAAMGEQPPAGLLVHIARETPSGFQVVEVWESKQQCDEFGDRVLAPIIDRVTDGQAPSRNDVMEEFEPENIFFGTSAATARS